MVEFYDTDLRKYQKRVDESSVKDMDMEIIRGKLLLSALRKLGELEEIYKYFRASLDFSIDEFDIFKQIVDMETTINNFAGDNLGIDLYDPKFEMDTHPMPVHYGSGIPFYDDFSDLKGHEEWQKKMKRGETVMVKINDLMGGGSD